MNDTELDWFNRLPGEIAIEQFCRCCGAETWCQAMTQHLPFANLGELHRIADAELDMLDEKDWKQAFDCHPQIGDLKSLRMKFAGNKDWSAGEQSGISAANDQILIALAKGNADYLAKFGYIFIVCASGKSASELLGILQQRLPLDPDAEFRNATAEQRKITHLRLDKMEKNAS